MPWFKKSDDKKATVSEQKENIWMRCKGCSALIYKEEWQQNLSVCPKCNYHDRLSCIDRVNLLFDAGSFKLFNEQLVPEDKLGFVDGKGSYRDKIADARKNTEINEAVITGTGLINEVKVVAAIMDFRFLGGSLGSVTGELIFQGAMTALNQKLPYIIVSASGGARMHEGALSLMQMAKTCSGIARLKEENIPYISILTDPTSGGVSASFAMMGDINMAEPGAMIAFAGRRVIEGTIKQKLPDNFQTAEYLLEKGFVDLIVQRKEMKASLSRMLRFYNRQH
jgi:acetyl-CoA carboxylase carboxyl transferase subunit beta